MAREYNRQPAMNANEPQRIPAPDGKLGADGLPLTVLPEGSILKKKYTISYLTAGGMGTVYEAKTQDDRRFIVKEVNQRNAIAVIALNQEKATLDRLSHPGIVKVEELFAEEEHYYLVIERIEGEDLQKKIIPSATEFIPENTVLEWVRHLLDIFEYLHRQIPPIIYRDLKPQNVIIDSQGTIRLIDFGIARVFKQFKDSDTIAMGTLITASPEHFGEEQTDARSDIYTIGATLYVLLTNNRAKRKRLFEFPPLGDINPHVSERTVKAIEKAVAMKPENRFQTIAEMREALIAGKPITASYELPHHRGEKEHDDLRSETTNLLPPETQELKAEEKTSLHKGHLKCPQCTAGIPEDSSFCEHCGTPIEAAPRPEDVRAVPAPEQSQAKKNPAEALTLAVAALMTWIRGTCIPSFHALVHKAKEKIRESTAPDTCRLITHNIQECITCIREKKPLPRAALITLIIAMTIIVGISAIVISKMTHRRSGPGSISGDQSPVGVDRLMEMARKSFDKGNFDKAEMQLQKVVKLDPQYLEAYWYIGKCREKRKKIPEALRAYKKYAAAPIKDLGRLHHISSLRMKSKDYKKALELEKKAPKETAEGNFIKGSCYYEQGNYDGALSCLKDATEMNMSDYDSHVLLAKCYKKKNKLADAVKAYNAAYALKPERITLLHEMAGLEKSLKNYHAAKDCLKRYIAAETDPQKKSEATSDLQQVTADAMKTIPPSVERQRDRLPGVEVKGILKFGDHYTAHIAIGEDVQEYKKGETLLSSYHILDINENRIVLTKNEEYFVLTTK